MLAGVTCNATTTHNLTAPLAIVAKETGHDFQLLQKSLDSLAKFAPDDQVALDYLLAEQRGVCAVANTSSAACT